MITYNTYYTDAETLNSFIELNNVTNSSNILIQVFTGICEKSYINGLIDNIKSLLPNSVIIGSTTDGEILNDNVSQYKTVLAISVFEKTKLLSFSSNAKENTTQTANSLISKIDKNTDLKLLITFGDGLNINGEKYVRAFENYDNSLVIVGGLAGDNAQFKNTYVFTQDGIVEKGVVAVGLYNPDLIVNTNYSFGWNSIGKYLKITSSKENVVYTINNIPAAKIYEKYLGMDIYNKLPSTGIEFPLIIKKDSMQIARAVVGKNDDDSLVFAGDINEGESVQFGFGNAHEIVANRLKIANDILDKPSESIFVYSCMARKYLLDKSSSVELNPLAQIAPLSGFFTYGEIFHDSKISKNEFLNQTLTTVSISENNISKKIDIDDDYNEEENQTIKALSYLASTSSKELYEVNKNLEQIIDEKTYELRVKNKELLQRYYYDELTGLGNRNLLIKEIADSSSNYSLISLDINRFNNINDLYGVENGDSVLTQFANLLMKIKQHNYCKVYRVSGNEFAILNKKPKDNNYANLVSYFINSIEENNFFINLKKEKIMVDLSVSIGIAYKTRNLIEKAHLALTHAKKENESYKVYQSDLKLEQNIKENIKYTKIIKDAIKNDKVVVYFQPIFRDGIIIKYETLVRIDNNGEILSPFKFLDLAKKNGDYFDLTKIIIEKSFKIFTYRDKSFSINLSFEDIQNKKIIEYLKTKIFEYSVQDKLVIEILEDESFLNYEIVKKFVHEMQELGIKIALDDFGSGYSNFTRVLELNVDFIKIDGSIISNIDTDTNSYIIAQTIAEFSKKLGIKTIAEYIHSQEVYKKAQELGVDEFQGFLLGEPKPL